MLRFQNRVVLITGSGSGMGRMAALRFAAEGAIIAGADLNQAGNAETLRLVTQAGGQMYTGDSVDLTNPKDTEAWIHEAVAKLGRIDVLYANAGATKFSPIEETSPDEWNWVLKHELDLTYFPIKYSWAALKASRGNIVLVGSTAGMRGSMTNTRVAHSVTKGGIIAMMQQLAGEGAIHGIRANSVSPGMIRTPSTEGDLLAASHPMQKIATAIPLQRIGTPEEVVNCTLFLASDEASYITGVNIPVDGGWSSVLPGFGVV